MKTLRNYAKAVALAERRLMELLDDALRDDFAGSFPDKDVRNIARMRQGPPASG